MTGDQIISQFEWLVDDETIDEDQELVLLNLAYDRLNTMREWNFLRTSQESQTISSGTASYAAPSDQLYPTSLAFYDSSNTAFTDLKLISFNDRMLHWNVGSYVYYDKKNDQYTFTRTPDGSEEYVDDTLIINYQYQPAQLAVTDTPVYDRAFHPLLAYEMARHYFYNDQGEKSRAWNTELDYEYNRMLGEMIRWDSLISDSLDSSFEPDNDWTNGLS